MHLDVGLEPVRGEATGEPESSRIWQSYNSSQKPLKTTFGLRIETLGPPSALMTSQSARRIEILRSPTLNSGEAARLLGYLGLQKDTRVQRGSIKRLCEALPDTRGTEDRGHGTNRTVPPAHGRHGVLHPRAGAISDLHLMMEATESCCGPSVRVGRTRLASKSNFAAVDPADRGPPPGNGRDNGDGGWMEGTVQRVSRGRERREVKKLRGKGATSGL